MQLSGGVADDRGVSAEVNVNVGEEKKSYAEYAVNAEKTKIALSDKNSSLRISCLAFRLFVRRRLDDFIDDRFQCF
jgi:hypothetical protein